MDSIIRVCEASLIEQVRMHPHLYDTRNKDYKDMRKCMITWNKIAKNLGSAGSWKVCKERWRTLRDVYVRNKKTEKERRPKWRFYDQMQFLNSYIIHKPTDNDLLHMASAWIGAPDVETVLCEDDSATIMNQSFEGPVDESSHSPSQIMDEIQNNSLWIKEEAVEWVEEDIEAQEDMKDEEEDPMANGHMEETTTFQPLPSKKRRRHVTPVQSPKRRSGTPEAPATQAISDTKEPQTKDPNSKDPPALRLAIPKDSLLHQCLVPPEEEELFGRYVAAAIRKFSPKTKSLAKMRIQKVLFEMEEFDR